MATAAEQVFVAAVRAAEGVRQGAKLAAWTTFSTASPPFSAAAFATYAAALTSADVAYVTSVNSAATTLSLAGYTVPNSGPSQAIVEPGGLGLSGPVSAMSSLGNGTATMGAIG
jgi:hypothetical protein